MSGCPLACIRGGTSPSAWPGEHEIIKSSLPAGAGNSQSQQSCTFDKFWQNLSRAESGMNAAADNSQAAVGCGPTLKPTNKHRIQAASRFLTITCINSALSCKITKDEATKHREFLHCVPDLCCRCRIDHQSQCLSQDRSDLLLRVGAGRQSTAAKLQHNSKRAQTRGASAR